MSTESVFPTIRTIRHPTDTRPDVTDSELVTRLQAGDEKAIEVLYDTYSRIVYTVACRILGISDMAEDVLHDTFMKLWREPGSFVMRTQTLRASLALCAYNSALSARKRLTT